MNRSGEMVVFRLDERRLALHLSAVERVIQAVEVTPLPGAPPVVMGAVNVQGHVLPVLDLRRRFGLPLREVTEEDQMILAHTSHRRVVLPVDEVSGVVDCTDDEVTAGEEIAQGMEFVEGVARRDDGLFLIHDLEKFLSAAEEHKLEESVPM